MNKLISISPTFQKNDYPDLLNTVLFVTGGA